MSADSRLLLGVDGGGTKTRAVLARVDGNGAFQVLGEGLGGTGNLRLAGRDVALHSLDQAVGTALEQAPGRNDPGFRLEGTVLALAGISDDTEREVITDWARRRPELGSVDIVPDWHPVLALGTPHGWGVGLIAGTGSVAFGRDQEGRLLMRGGWGHWFGDHGSGFDLGRGALVAVTRAEDGYGPSTSLEAAVLTHFGIASTRFITRELATGGNARRDIAALAPLVLAASEAGDAVARRILHRGADELARLVRVTARALDFADGFPLALAGSVICGSAAYRAMLQTELAKEGPQPAPFTLVPDPVMGCIELARQRLHRNRDNPQEGTCTDVSC